MTEIQQVLAELLQEIDNICMENNIQYFLYGKTAAFAKRSGGFEGDAYSASVAMTEKDCYKFIKCFEKLNCKDRYLESMLNSKNFPRVVLRYGNSNTLDFDVESWGRYKNQGIHVDIEILRKAETNKYSKFLHRFLEIGWETVQNRKRFSKKKYAAALFVGFISHLVGKQRFSRWLFHVLVNPDRKGNGTQYFVKNYWGKRKYYSKYWFDKAVRIKFEDNECNICWVPEQYLKNVFGPLWKTKNISTPPPNPAVRLFDVKLPFKDYMDTIYQGDINPGRIWKIRNKYIKRNSHIPPLNTQMSDNWQKLFMAGDRYNMWEYYQPKKLYLKELYRSGNIKVLAKVLKPYENLLKQYSKQKMAFCFDKEIFEMLEYSMIKLGKIGTFQKIAKLVPKRHMKEIQLVDYNGNVIEKEQVKGMREADINVLPAIKTYLKRDVGNCVYLYIDICKYGLDNPNMKVWYDTDTNGINLVVMKYYDSIQVYSHVDTWDADQVCELINKEHTSMVSGQKRIIEKIYPQYEDAYKIEYGYVFRMTSYREFENVETIETATIEDTHEIAELICSNESIGGYYEVQNLAQQLAERMETGIGRNLLIRKEGKIIAHIATYAEYNNIAVTGGLIAKADDSNIPYGTILESRLVLDLLSEKFHIYTFVTEKKRAKFLKLMDCEEYGRYGKMTLKE